MTKLIFFLICKRWWVLTITLLSSLGAASLTSQLRIDNALAIWFVDDDPTLLSYRDFQKRFGSDELVLTMLRSSETVLTDSALSRLHVATQELAKISGVEKVLTLSNAQYAQDGAKGLSLVTLGQTNGGATLSSRAKKILTKSPLMQRLVTDEGRAFVLYTLLENTPDLEQNRGRIFSAMNRVLERSFPEDNWRIHHGGFGVVYQALNQAALKEGGLFIGLSYLIIVVAFWVVTRRWQWMLMGVVVISLADLSLFGFMAVLGHNLNIVTIAVPTLVMVLGVADMLHFISHLETSGCALQRHDENQRVQQLARYLAQIAKPCLFNSLTTAGALLSLMLSSVKVTRYFGLFSALGVLMAFVFTLVCFAIVAPGLPKLAQRSGIRHGVSKAMIALVTMAHRRRLVVIFVSLCVLAAASFGLTQIQVDTYSLGFLPQKHRAYSDNEALEKILGAYLPLELLVRPAEGHWQQAELLRAVRQLQLAMGSEERLGGSLSVVDVVGELAAALQQEDADFAAQWFPQDDNELQQLLLVGESIQPDFGGLVDDSDGTLRISMTVRMGSSREFVATMDSVLEKARELLPQTTEVTTSGYLPLYGQLTSRSVSDQLRSFAMAFAVVFVLIALILRDWRFCLIAIPVNVLPVIFVLGLMGFASIRLDLATVTIAATVLGVVVDDSVHLLVRLKDNLQKEPSLQQALEQSAGSSGVAVLCTSCIICSGFFTIALASVKSVSLIGLLSGIAVVIALICDLLLLPALVSLVTPRNKSAGAE